MQQLLYGGIRRVELGDRIAHGRENKCNDTDEEKREHTAEADVGARTALASAADLIADENRNRHGNRERQHVDDGSEVHCRLVRREHRRPVRRH